MSKTIHIKSKEEFNQFTCKIGVTGKLLSPHHKFKLSKTEINKDKTRVVRIKLILLGKDN